MKQKTIEVGVENFQTILEENRRYHDARERIATLEAALREIANFDTAQSYHDEYDIINAMKNIAKQALKDKQ